MVMITTFCSFEARLFIQELHETPLEFMQQAFALFFNLILKRIYIPMEAIQ